MEQAWYHIYSRVKDRREEDEIVGGWTPKRTGGEEFQRDRGDNQGRAGGRLGTEARAKAMTTESLWAPNYVFPLVRVSFKAKDSRA